MGHFQENGSKSDGWLIHAAIVLCTFGPRSHTIDPVTRQRREHRYHGEPINMYALVEEDRISTHGITIAETREDQLDRIETYRTIVDSEYYPVRGYPASYVQRMGLLNTEFYASTSILMHFVTRYSGSERIFVPFSARH